LAQQNGFDPVCAQFAEAGKGTQQTVTTTPAREECNKYDEIAASLFLIDSSRWFAIAITSLPPICSTNFRFIGGFGKNK
jgi:hypothetical protein